MKADGYYDVHSEYQRRIIEGGQELIRALVSGLDLEPVGTSFAIADYGAGTGATSVHATGVAIAALRERARDLPVWTLHNDLPTNDFSQLFRAVGGPDGYLDLPGGPIFPAAAVGSFFEQVLPAATVNLGMCSNAAHWFRHQPDVELPEGMYFSEASDEARRRLAKQAAGDWLAFLTARASELAPGAILLVQGIATLREDDGNECVSARSLLRVMSEVARSLVAKGALDGAALRRYVFPVYCRSREEVTEPVADGGPLSGAFEITHAAAEEVSNPYWEMLERDGDPEAYADAYATFVRAFSESTLIEHLFEPGARGVDATALCEDFFSRFRATTAADPERGRYRAWILRTAFRRV
jgi:cyclopropane-fatty-acyl-phospholipid synthase